MYILYVCEMRDNCFVTMYVRMQMTNKITQVHMYVHTYVCMYIIMNNILQVLLLCWVLELLTKLNIITLRLLPVKQST